MENIIHMPVETDFIEVLNTGACASRSTGGSAPVYNVNGISTPIPQHLHYAWRGEALALIPLYLYVAIIVIVPKTPPDSSLAQRREANQTFDFAEQHPLVSTHTQRLRSKQVTPILAGIQSPNPPTSGVRPAHPSASWLRQSREFAKYFLVLFKPWDTTTGIYIILFTIIMNY
jgi:hypothetical protein